MLNMGAAIIDIIINPFLPQATERIFNEHTGDSNC